MRSRFLLGGDLRGAQRSAPEEEVRAHAFAVSAVFAIPNQAAIYIAMHNIRHS
jgi:hypothetical protein